MGQQYCWSLVVGKMAGGGGGGGHFTNLPASPGPSIPSGKKILGLVGAICEVTKHGGSSCGLDLAPLKLLWNGLNGFKR